MESQIVKVEPAMEQDERVIHSDDVRTASAEYGHLPIKTEPMDEEDHSAAVSECSVTDSYNSRLSGTKDAQEITVKKEPLDWMDFETCQQDVDATAENNIRGNNGGVQGIKGSLCENGTEHSAQSVACSRGGVFRVRFKDASPENVTVKTEPLDLSANSLFGTSGAVLDDASNGNTAEEVENTSGVNTAENEARSSDDDIDGSDGDDDDDDDDDHDMELPIYFQPDKDLPSIHRLVCQHCSKVFKCTDDCRDHEEKEHSKVTVKRERLSPERVTEGRQNILRGQQAASKLGKVSERRKKTYAERGKNNQPCKCQECGREFANAKYLRSHMRVHSDVKPFTCDQCSSAFVRSSDLRRHKKTHTGEKSFKCQLCDSAFADSCKLKIHMRIHTGERPYKCELCGEGFSQPSQYARHMRVHNGEKPFQCSYCPSAFTMTSDYRRHLKIHTGERPFMCEFCPASFPEAKNLRIHMRTHTGEKPFKCEICNSNFAQAANLSRHLKTHTGEKPAKCDLCPSAFADKHKLRVHMRSHSGEKPYRCQMCPAAFSTSSSLNRHNIMHSGEKPFKCEHCPALFAHMPKLRLHAVCHTFDGPFKCQLCTASFKNAYGLTVHSHVHE
ncbi:uncharacterized protein LOC143291661 [Babylonia areolata]|uniref:uncharacterized protein LOC143291661 n=1 Tax=Babylonia areolata TaxID=304850 RepID=UPI003FD10254